MVKATNGISATTPAHKLGSVDVVHTDTDGWSITRAKGFNFVPPPSLTWLNPKAGPTAGGTTLILSGTYFATGDKGSAFGSKTSRVMFCTHFINKSDKTIVVKTPQQVPGLSDVAVINPDGQIAVLDQAFLFRPPPKPSKLGFPFACGLRPLPWTSVTELFRVSQLWIGPHQSAERE